MDLTGKVAVVTGASQGIGASIGRVLHDAGMAVALLARSEDKLAALAAELGDRALPVRCDVGDPDSVRAAFATVGERFGRVDALVNNAGAIGMSLLADADDEHVQSIVAVTPQPVICPRALIPDANARYSGEPGDISFKSVIVALSHKNARGPLSPIEMPTAWPLSFSVRQHVTALIKSPGRVPRSFIPLDLFQMYA